VQDHLFLKKPFLVSTILRRRDGKGENMADEKKRETRLLNLNITVVAVVALVAIVGLTAIVLNGKNGIVSPSPGFQILDSNGTVLGDASGRCATLRYIWEESASASQHVKAWAASQWLDSCRP
jgi:hypothetical protein